MKKLWLVMTWEVGQRKGCTSKHDYPMLENQAESSMYEVISLISIDDSSIMLARNEEPNTLYLCLARNGHWQVRITTYLAFYATYFDGSFSFKVDWIEQIFEKPFMTILLYSESFRKKAVERKLPKKSFFIFRLVWRSEYGSIAAR